MCSSCQSSNDHQYCQHNKGHLLRFQTRLLYRVVKSTLPPWGYWWCHCYTAQLFGLPTTRRIRYCLTKFNLILLFKVYQKCRKHLFSLKNIHLIFIDFEDTKWNEEKNNNNLPSPLAVCPPSLRHLCVYFASDFCVTPKLETTGS